MRRALAGIALAVTSMVALSFLVPLALLVREQARDRATTVAEQRAAAVSPVLALTTRRADVQQAVVELGSADQLAVRLPDGGLVGAPHAPEDALERAVRRRETLALDTADGWVHLQPVVLPRDRVAVVEAYVPAADLTRGVAASWGVMALLALGLVGGSVLVADRLGARVVRSSRSLKRASLALGSGDLHVRVEPDGPPELQEAGAAFNTMADRVVDLLAVERELVADLSHRLRTPLTALYLEADRMGATESARRVTEAAVRLETELDSIITAARTPLAAAQPGGAATATAKPCDVSEVVAARLEFWSVLAAQQERPCERYLTPRPTPVRFAEDDLAAVIDALIGNVFRHTAQGTAFAVRVERERRHVLLTVDDAGPGVADPGAALTRGVSVTGSTGLGLDIVGRAARATDGELTIGRAPLGGARVRVSLALVGGG
ncbi:HAMP domain-containing histidine kinase [Streptomyces sp. ISL-12]|uniref:HAMP domain-containing sensor histidine kinase n=1 Tax=Streptomyces sp. ISL-12 TaxID=2819177 RepID=UPI001BE92C76|nr:HAMP domain-containing sensor histidine kinase [Streptomyces sp. ISL-12]MBT2410554.1 HAMP domain-containing histidine kinase [Streptomyces sp. ISL-12]